MTAVHLTWPSISQLLVSGVVIGTAYGVLGVGFAIILGVTGRFHYAFGFTYTLGAYAAFWAFDRAKLPFVIAALFGIAICVLSGVGIERVVYRTLARQAGGAALLAIFVASLGLAIAGENVLRLAFSSASQQLAGPSGFRKAIHWGPTSFRYVDLWQVVSGLLLIAALTALLRYTGLGRSIKATRGNPEMAQIIGINPNTIYLICFATGSLFAGVEALWFGLKYSLQADMGFTPVIYAFVIGFLAGTASAPVRVFLTGVAVGVVQSLSSLFLETRWTQLVVFVILVIYLTTLSIDPKALVARLRRTTPTPASALGG